MRLETAELSIGELSGTIEASASIEVPGGDWEWRASVFSKTFSAAAEFPTDGPIILVDHSNLNE